MCVCVSHRNMSQCNGSTNILHWKSEQGDGGKEGRKKLMQSALTKNTGERWRCWLLDATSISLTADRAHVQLQQPSCNMIWKGVNENYLFMWSRSKSFQIKTQQTQQNIVRHRPPGPLIQVFSDVTSLSTGGFNFLSLSKPWQKIHN